MRKLLPVFLALCGLLVGTGAGFLLHSEPAPEPAVAEPEITHETPAETPAESENAPEYVKLNNQFVVPVVEQDRVAALVILSLNLEVETGATEDIYAKEPKLRDAFLQVLFDHANSGGFKGAFTDGANLVLLRRALLEAAQKAIGPTVRDVLIADIARQDSA